MHMSFLVAVQIFCDSVLLIHCLQLLPLLYGGGGGGGVYGSCFVVQCLVSSPVLKSSHQGRESWLLYLFASQRQMTY